VIHSGPAALEIKDGFVTIETAERIRQSETKQLFCVKNGELYERALRNLNAMKTALQAWEQDKAQIARAADGVKPGDILDCLERDSKELLAAQATLAQAEQLVKKQKRS
jgi:hypothetical protein